MWAVGTGHLGQQAGPTVQLITAICAVFLLVTAPALRGAFPTAAPELKETAGECCRRCVG